MEVAEKEGTLYRNQFPAMVLIKVKFMILKNLKMEK